MDIDDEPMMKNKPRKSITLKSPGKRLLDTPEPPKEPEPDRSFIKNCFYGTMLENTREDSQETDSGMVEESEFFQILLPIDSDQNLYESWDSAFNFSAHDGPKTFHKTRWVKFLPKVLTF
jgi:hypothetical protein